MRLSDSQIQAFNENGYHLYGPLLSVEEADRMAQVSLACVENFHSEHESQRVNKIYHSASGDGIAAAFYQLRCAHLMHPGFESVVRDERLLDAVESLLGPNLRLIIWWIQLSSARFMNQGLFRQTPLEGFETPGPFSVVH